MESRRPAYSPGYSACDWTTLRCALSAMPVEVRVLREVERHLRRVGRPALGRVVADAHGEAGHARDVERLLPWHLEDLESVAEQDGVLAIGVRSELPVQLRASEVELH